MHAFIAALSLLMPFAIIGAFALVGLGKQSDLDEDKGDIR